MADFKIRKEILIQAPPEVVFRHLTEGELVVGWGGTHAELQPEPGGIYRVSMGNDMILRGEFLEVDPPRRLVYTWGWEGSPLVPPGSTRVEIDLRAEGTATRLVLVHTAVPPDAEEKTNEGWEHYLDRLRRLIETGSAGPDVMGGAHD